MTSPAPATNKPDAFEPDGGSALARVGRAWDRFFFSPADPTTLAVMRICCGLVALYTVIAFGLDLQEIFGPHGWMSLETRNQWRHEYPFQKFVPNWDPPAPPDGRGMTPEQVKQAMDYYNRWGIYPEWTLVQGQPVWSLWFHVTDPTAMAVVQGLCVLVTFCFLIGLATRVTGVLAWFAMISYIHRSPMTVFGVDTMMSIAMLYLMIGPSGAALSVDRLIRRWWQTGRALRRARAAGDRGEGGPVRLPDMDVPPSVSANFVIRLLQIHVCIIYGAAGLAKLQGGSWWSGQAVWGTLSNFDFAPMQYSFYNAFLLFLCQHRPLWEMFMNSATVFTLFFEIGYPFLVWGRRTRWLVLAMAVTLHGGIGIFMGLKTFSLMMLTLNMAFVPPEMWRRLLRGLAHGPAGLRLSFPAQSRKAVRAAALVHALDAWDQVQLVERPGAEGGLVLETPRGGKRTGAGVWTGLLVNLGVFRITNPWNWVTALGRRPQPAGPAPRPLPPMPDEPAGLRPGPESRKVPVTAVKPKR